MIKSVGEDDLRDIFSESFFMKLLIKWLYRIMGKK